MLYKRKPSVITAYVFGVDDGAMKYVKEDENGFFVVTVQGQTVGVEQGEYIVPEVDQPELPLRAYPVEAKAFERSYSRVEYEDVEEIKEDTK